MTTSRHLNTPKFPWTDDQVETLRRLYPHVRTELIAIEIGCTTQQAYGKANYLKLKKSAEFLASPASGRISYGQQLSPHTQFQKGCVPPLAGKKIPGYAPGRMGETQFKKGHLGGQAARKLVPIGTEVVKPDGYRWRKVRSTGNGDWRQDWRQVHILTWEMCNGPVPKGHVICFRDRNRANTAIENLECISRQELTRRNTIHRYPDELKQVIRLQGKLRRTIAKKTENETATP